MPQSASFWRVIRSVLILTPAFALVIAGVWYAVRQFENPSLPPPSNGKLVVVVVFDQMRGDYPARWAQAFGSDGFERIKADGVWYSDAHLPYANSATGPGHASIATGVPPSVHGIVENDWYDRSTGKRTYCAAGTRPYPRVPGYAAAAPKWADEASLCPERLLAPTVADLLFKATEGKGRCFSMALKDRAAVLMGGKNPAGCYCFDNTTGEFHTSAYYRDSAPAWVIGFNKSNAADAWLGKEWTRLLDAEMANKLAGPDDAAGEADGPSQMGKVFPHPYGRGVTEAGPRYFTALESSPAGNELLWSFAKTCIEAENLGNDGHADLVCLGFSANDGAGHAWGPDSHEVLDITLRSDQLLAEIRKFLINHVGKDRFTLIVTADHGVCPLPERSVNEHPEAARFHGRSELAAVGEVLDKAFGQRDVAPGKWVEKVDYPWIYLDAKYAEANGVPLAELASVAAKWAANRPNILAAYTRADLTGPTANDPMLRAAQRGFHPDRCGDVYAISRPYLLGMGVGSTGTNHGTPHDYDTHVPILAIGQGIPKLGRQTDRVSSLILAPLVGRALGLEPAAAWEQLPPGFAEK